MEEEKIVYRDKTIAVTLIELVGGKWLSAVSIDGKHVATKKLPFAVKDDARTHAVDAAMAVIDRIQ
ncbi:hypothetical protein ACIPF8_19175 [Collimonas sp. NPDC087041]|uniref:hypothetical protein n=1 Tax=Collimonas sp. NPDC087041 TaxID=3363960 RepID=UPI00382CB5B8